MSPSYYHSYITSQLIALLHQCKDYSVFAELTLQIRGKDYIPDICLYPKRKLVFTNVDLIRMADMPVLAIEVLSPTQGVQDILDKFPIYFEAGIRSCWLVVPITQSVIVYHDMAQAQTFYTGEIVDAAVNLKLSVEAIFE